MHKFKSLFSGTLIKFFDESRPMHSAASSLSQHAFSYVKLETAFVCLDFGSTLRWNLALHLGLDLCSNSTLLVPALNKDKQGYRVMLLTTS